MQPIIEAFSLKHANHCVDKNCPNLVLGNSLYASRLSYSFTQDEIACIVKHKKNTKIWIKVNAFFFEHNLEALTIYLKWLSTLEIDYVIFQDYAVAQINHEQNLKLKLHYNPESLVTSYGQFEFFTDNQFSGCFLARELTMPEIKIIAENKKSLLLEVQGFGFGLIMHSRWKLLNNFADFYDLQFKKQPVWIKERLRKFPNLVFEDQHGTHMLTGYLINTFKQLSQLFESNIDLYQMSFLKLTEQQAIALTDLTLDAFSDLHAHSYNCDKYIRHCETILENKYLMSAGFMDTISNQPHLAKESTDDK